MAGSVFLIKKRHLIDRELEALIGRTRDMPRGEVIAYEEIERITGLTKDVYPWQALANKWRRWMARERNICIVAEIKIGYRLTTPDEQVIVAVKTEKRAAKMIGQSYTMASVVEEKELTEDGRKRRGAIMMHAEDVMAARQKSYDKRKTLLSVRPALPRPRE